MVSSYPILYQYMEFGLFPFDFISICVAIVTTYRWWRSKVMLNHKVHSCFTVLTVSLYFVILRKVFYAAILWIGFCEYQENNSHRLQRNGFDSEKLFLLML